MFEHSKMLNRIKSEKKKRGLTNILLAEATGIPLGTLNKILSGDSKDPQISAIIKIAHALDVSADYLVFGKEPEGDNHTYDNDEGVVLYKQLDKEDQAEIRGEIKQMLKAEKYQTSKSIAIKKRKPFSGTRPAQVAAYGHGVTGIDNQ